MRNIIDLQAWQCSSVGRALACSEEGGGFKSQHSQGAFFIFFVLSLASNASDGQMTLFIPFSSDKIRAKILDLGYGGARHEPSIT